MRVTGWTHVPSDRNAGTQEENGRARIDPRFREALRGVWRDGMPMDIHRRVLIAAGMPPDHPPVHDHTFRRGQPMARAEGDPG
jgi:hypothetical protein